MGEVIFTDKFTDFIPDRPQNGDDGNTDDHMIEASHGGNGGRGGGSMEGRVTALEIRLEEFDKRTDLRLGNVERRFDTVDAQLDRIEKKIPTEWMMAKVVFYVVGALMAASFFGPRLLSMINTGS